MSIIAQYKVIPPQLMLIEINLTWIKLSINPQFFLVLPLIITTIKPHWRYVLCNPPSIKCQIKVILLQLILNEGNSHLI